MTRVDVVDIGDRDVAEAAGVLARGMRDNPLHVAAFGPDPDRRVRATQRMFGGVLGGLTGQEPFGLRRDGRLVAVTGAARPGTCRPAARESIRLLPGMIALGPATMGRVAKWLRAWRERDPDEPHSHLGPLAVDSRVQRQGLGTVLLAEYCRRLDAAGHIGYLETDRPENVRFYERGGFQVIDEAEVLGLPNWFMRRPGASG